MVPTSTVAGNDSILGDIPCDPKTPAGQKVGAVLVVKRIAAGSQQSQVHDRVFVETMQVIHCQVQNLRCNIEESLEWTAFFASSKGEMCYCQQHSDRQKKCCMWEVQAEASAPHQVHGASIASFADATQSPHSTHVQSSPQREKKHSKSPTLQH